MYAVIETGGKQYRVEVGTELEVELLDVEPGKTITLDRVLLVADGDESTIGRPLVADASVSAEVLDQTRGPKLISFKYRPKARSRVKKGHRQELTVLRIADIMLGGKSAAKDGKKAADDAKTERMRLEEAAAAQAAKDAELAAKLAVGSGGGRQEGRHEGQDKAPRPTLTRRRRPRPRPTASRRRRPTPRARRPRRSRRRRPSPRRCQDRDEGGGSEEDDREGRRAQGEARGQEDHEEGRVDQMAHKKAGGSVKNGRDSVGQRLGVKAGDGQLVNAGSIIVRQRGMTFLAGPGTGLGHDYTVFATITGKVKFEHATKSKKRIRVEAVETTAASAEL